jgi:hypothetical protein
VRRQAGSGETEWNDSFFTLSLSRSLSPIKEQAPLSRKTCHIQLLITPVLLRTCRRQLRRVKQAMCK